MATFNIFNKEGKKVGCVIAQSEGHAKNKAVENKIVPGRRQIGKVKQVPYNDPYEQSFKDIYGWSINKLKELQWDTMLTIIWVHILNYHRCKSNTPK